MPEQPATTALDTACQAVIAAWQGALCGPAGAYMTGQTIHINGGLSNSGV